MFRRIVITSLAVMFFAAASPGEDWPCWRYDAGHTAATPEELPKKLHFQWTRHLGPIDRAWPDDDRLEFDIAYEPIVAGSMLYIGSPRNDAIMAFDAATGEAKWKFFTGGPVRLAPTVSDGLLYAGSDDGYVYCLDAATGAEVWRFKAALGDRRVIGNKRMISLWPVRGAPVVYEGIVYCAAGIWPFEGVSVYALDAKTGDVVWLNDNCDVTFMLQPHHSPAFAGIAPQGYTTVEGDSLLVPNGRALPARFDRKTGKMLYFELDPNSKIGTYQVSAKGKYFVNSGGLYDLETGRNFGYFPMPAVLTDDIFAAVARNGLVAYDIGKLTVEKRVDRDGDEYWKWNCPELWSVNREAVDMIRAGERYYACGPGGVFAFQLSRWKEEPKVVWEDDLGGERPVRLAAANGRLYVSTMEGAVHCFGGDNGTEKEWPFEVDRMHAEGVEVQEGYQLYLGAGSGAAAGSVARLGNSEIRAVALDGSAESADAARRALDEQGLYGPNAAVLTAELTDLPLYFATQAFVLDADAAWVSDKARVAELYDRLRPYGGEARIEAAEAVVAALKKTVEEAELPNAEFEMQDGVAVIRRAGALPGSADWTHQYADSSNSVVSKETRVRTPLGMLWFGGSSNKDILPRHGHGPSEQVVGGRLFIEGPDMIRAVDVYTGRVLWQVSLPGFGKPYDNTSHQPGANSLGSNYVSLNDGIYVAYGEKVLRLDPATGKKMSEFNLPEVDGQRPDFGYIGVYQDVLVAGSGPLRYDEEIKGKTWNAIASKRIVAMNRHTGEPLWTRTADAAFRHNAIALGAGKVFCINDVTDKHREHLARRGITLPEQGQLFALDIETGKTAWETAENVFGTWLGYSVEHDMLLQAGRASRDMLDDEANDRMIMYKAADGKVVWDRKVRYDGPCLLHGDTIIAQEQFFSLLTGETIERQHPLTGEPLAMNWNRQYGCNTAVACENLVTFRSAAAGYFDLRTDGGTGNLGGFKSGCTSNLLAANGVLNAPDYTRTCICSYQNQTSLAFVYTPGVEMWTYNAMPAGEGRIERVGLNFGAPGDRRAENGTLWLDCPSVGGRSPDVGVATQPEQVSCFRVHSLRVSGDGPGWVVASGAEGVRQIEATVAEGEKKKRPYTVRLYFAEPDGAEKGQRVFNVSLQGKRVLANFDIVAEAGGKWRGVVKEFNGVVIKDALKIELKPKGDLEPVLCGVEIVQE